MLKNTLCSVNARQIRLALQDIYAIADQNIARMIRQHLEGILAHWLSHITNAFMDALNSVFSAVKRKARGFRSNSILIAMLYFLSAFLNIPAFH
ncbi:MAG: transposase [Opitutaceae bacterium]|nr:transposase [Opitutaceae bacterium]